MIRKCLKKNIFLKKFFFFLDWKSDYMVSSDFGFWFNFEPKFWPKPKDWMIPKPKPKCIPKPKFRPKPKPKPKVSDHYFRLVYFRLCSTKFFGPPLERNFFFKLFDDAYLTLKFWTFLWFRTFIVLYVFNFLPSFSH